MDTTDGDIIGRVLAGDHERFHVLVRRHAAPLWGTVRAALADREDAREVFQETWLRALERLDTLRDPRRLRAWLVSIALNLVRQRMRRRAFPMEPDPRLEEEPDRTEGVEDAVERREELGRLRRGIAALPPRQREVVDLRVSHGLTHAEIGELLGIREEASRASYYQALRRLRGAFEGNESEEQEA